MHQCWHPNPSGRPKFSDLHQLFDRYLTKHTQEKYPYIDMDSNVPYTFDHLTPKSLSDYRAHIKEVLTIEEIRDESGEKRDNDIGNGILEPPLIYIDNKHKESSDRYSNGSDCAGGTSTHAGLYRLHEGHKNTPQTYDQLTPKEDESYDREILDTLKSIYMIDSVDDDEYYDELWRKKLSTITEASNEDYQN